MRRAVTSALVITAPVESVTRPRICVETVWAKAGRTGSRARSASRIEEPSRDIGCGQYTMPASLLLVCLLMQSNPRVERLMRDVLIFDAHVDTPRYTVDEGYRWADEHPYYETDIPR